MKAFRALVRAELATFSRDKTTLVFTFLFPLLFILIFGALMSGFGEAKEAHIGVVSVDEERDVLDRVVAEIGSLSISRFEDEARLREALLKDDEDFGIVWTGTTLRFLYNAGRLQENSAFEEVARGIASRFNLVRQGITPILAIDVTEIGGGDDATWLDLLLPGILAFSVFSAGLFAVSGHLTGMKQRRLLDRLIVTPMRPIALLAAIVVAVSYTHLTLPTN